MFKIRKLVNISHNFEFCGKNLKFVSNDKSEYATNFTIANLDRRIRKFGREFTLQSTLQHNEITEWDFERILALIQGQKVCQKAVNQSARLMVSSKKSEPDLFQFKEFKAQFGGSQLN